MEYQSDSEGHLARLAQLVERQTFNLVVVGSSPTVGTRVVGLKQLGIIFKILIRRRPSTLGKLICNARINHSMGAD
jgi:hypothetical protein